MAVMAATILGIFALGSVPAAYADILPYQVVYCSNPLVLYPQYGVVGAQCYAGESGVTSSAGATVTDVGGGIVAYAYEPGTASGGGACTPDQGEYCLLVFNDTSGTHDTVTLCSGTIGGTNTFTCSYRPLT